MSIGSYWWNCTAECPQDEFPNCSAWKHSDLGPPGPPYANCSTTTGLPWYDHDGYHNPISDDLDGPRLGSLSDAVVSLSLSNFYFNQTSHGERAIDLLRTWFLNPDTQMLPSGAFAQGIPGRCEGRGIGLIDFATSIPNILEAIQLLRFCGTMPSTDFAQLQDWMRQWLSYLTDSSNGQDEAAAKNNHGSNYDKHVVAVAAFLQNTSFVEKVCEEAGPNRVAVQVGPNGTLPMEDSRTKSEEYHMFDTIALLNLATLCNVHAHQSDPSKSLFDYIPTSSGAAKSGLHDVVEWLEQFVPGESARQWPFTQIRPVPNPELSFGTIYRLAANAPQWSADAQHYESLAQTLLNASETTPWEVVLTTPSSST